MIAAYSLYGHHLTDLQTGYECRIAAMSLFGQHLIDLRDSFKTGIIKVCMASMCLADVPGSSIVPYSSSELTRIIN